eukprot:jgi/Phyca11/100720/e_gw1.5.1080.1
MRSIVQDAHVLGLQQIAHHLDASIPVYLTRVLQEPAQLGHCNRDVRSCSTRQVHEAIDERSNYLNHYGIKHEKTVPYTPQQNGLAEQMNRSLGKMARCMLYHESVDRKWWAEAINTAAWIINRTP